MCYSPNVWVVLAALLMLLHIVQPVRSPRKLIPFAPEASYIVPSAERDALPRAQEGTRLELNKATRKPMVY